MSNWLLEKETKNFLVFAEDLSMNAIVIFEKEGNFIIHATKKEATEAETINRISENLYKVFFAKKQQKPPLLTKIIQFFTGAK